MLDHFDDRGKSDARSTENGRNSIWALATAGSHLAVFAIKKTRESSYAALVGIRKYLRVLGLEYLFYYRRNYRRRYSYSKFYDTDHRRYITMVKEKNLIFTVTAGRSGTVFLQNILGILPDVTSLHEPDPAFHGCLRHIQREPKYARDFLLNIKLPAIANFSTRHYAEVSHVFCKGFLNPLLDIGVTPNLIVLRRAPRSIALSYLNRNAVPGRTALGMEYLLTPDDPEVLLLPNWRQMSDYQLLFWYAIEIERRQATYASLVTKRGGRVFDTTAEELYDAECFIQLATGLGILSSRDNNESIVEKHAHLKVQRYNQNRFFLRFKLDLDAQEEEVWDAIQKTNRELQPNLRDRHFRAAAE
jgi:hypothetical protein